MTRLEIEERYYMEVQTANQTADELNQEAHDIAARIITFAQAQLRDRLSAAAKKKWEAEKELAGWVIEEKEKP